MRYVVQHLIENGMAFAMDASTSYEYLVHNNKHNDKIVLKYAMLCLGHW